MSDSEKKVNYLPDIHRLLPQSPDAEQGFLCSYLLAPAEMHSLAVERGVTAEWFHLPAHQLIYVALEAMTHTKTAIDFITLTTYLRDCDYLEQCGGAAFVSQLFTFLPTAANASYYLSTIAQKHAARELIRACTEYARRAYDEQDSVGDLIDEAQGRILAINRPDSTGQESIEHIRPSVIAAIDAIEDVYRHRGGLIGLPTGIHGIDRMTMGLRGPQLVIIAGRPSMGKTALAMGVAEHIALKAGKPVLIFSLEMNRTELATRLVCSGADINLQRVRDGYLTKEQFERKMPAVVESIGNAPIYIDETPGISIQELRVRVRRHIRLHPATACVVIDYLQIMSSNTKRGKDNRAMEIAEISGGLKNLAKEINRPILVGAQLNRDNDGANSPPKLSNLRESGSIEQDADIVMLLHRRHYYTHDADDEGKATIDLAKQRNGPTGPIQCVFSADFARFANNPGEELFSNDPKKRQGNLYAEEEEA